MSCGEKHSTLATICSLPSGHLGDHKSAWPSGGDLVTTWPQPDVVETHRALVATRAKMPLVYNEGDKVLYHGHEGGKPYTVLGANRDRRGHQFDEYVIETAGGPRTVQASELTPWPARVHDDIVTEPAPVPVPAAAPTSVYAADDAEFRRRRRARR